MKNGKYPALLIFILTALVMQAQTPVLWGTTAAGGTGTGALGGQGTLFSFDVNNNILTVQHNFTDTDGGPNGALTLAGNGLFYGMTSESTLGVDTGAIYSFNRLTGAVTKVYGFGTGGMCCDGESPSGALLLASDGFLYGTTAYGGNLGGGTIFKLDITTGNETVTHNFAFNQGEDGMPTAATLLQANNGLLYGTTLAGGLGYAGEAFSFNTVTDSVVAVADSIRFTGSVRQLVSSAIMQANDSLLFGTTSGNNTVNLGMIYSLNLVTGAFTDVYDFGAGNDGANSRSTLFKASDGLLYGMTVNGGQYGYGIIYSYNVSTGLESAVYSLGNDTDGKNPFGSFIQAGNGLLYATTVHGGAYGFGTIFNYDIATATENVVYSFDSIHGSWPASALLLTIDTPEGIRNVSTGLQLQIYPNPATCQLYIKTENIQPQTLTIYDVDGRMILTQPFKPEMDINRLSSGVYFIEVISNGQVARERFVKM